MGELEIRPRNFYKQRFFTGDGFLSAAYTDRTLRDGIVSGSIQNQAAADRYIFSVSTPQIPKFGAYGSPNQQYLFLNVQDIVMENYAEPIYKVYKKRKPLTLVTGSYTDLDSSVTVFSSQVNYQGTIMSETFDGTNKGFGQDLETQPQLLISAESEDNGKYILMEDVRAFAKKKGLTTRRIGIGGNPNQNLNPVMGDVVIPGEYSTVTSDGYAVPAYETVDIRKSRAVLLTADQIAGGQDKLFLQKKRNAWGTSEAWSAEAYMQLFKESRFGGNINKSYEYLFGSESEFNKRGMKVYTDVKITKLDRNIVEETANTTATQYNTLFNTMVLSDNFNDVKTQTLETTGDDTEPYAYSMCYFSKDDKVEGPQALVMDNYWENYSGTATSYGQRRKINFPGVVVPDLMSGYQYPQEVTVGIGNIPEIIPLELGSGSTTDTTATPDSYSTVGEIEIVFKVKTLATVASGNTAVSDTEDYNTLRSMNFVFGSSPMQASERFWDYIYRMADGGGSFAAPEQMMGVGILNSGNTGSYRVYDMGSVYSYFTDAAYYVGAGTASTNVLQTDTFPAASYVDIPYDEWVTMRVKIDPQRATQLCYFPDIQTGAGVMGSFELVTTRNLACSGAQAISSLAINNSNFRSINSESATVSNANYALVADGDLNSDNRGTLIIDKISFKNYNLDIVNASDVSDNPNTTEISLKSPPAGVPRGNVGGVPQTYLTTANDNYFLKPSCPMPGMIAIGYDSTDFIPYDSSTYDTGSRVDLFFSGYDSINSDSNQITKNLFRFGISTEQTGSVDARLGIPYAGMLVGSGGSGDLAMVSTVWPNYSVEGIDKSIDGGVQKGLIAMFASGGTTTNPNYINKDLWVRRESPFAQARILQVSPNGYKIQIDNTQIFSLPLGDNKTNYIFYKLGGQWDDTNHRPVEGSMLGFVDASTPMSPLYATDVDDEGWVTLNRRIPSSALDDIHHYAIGPYKYWLNISYFNAEYETAIAKWGGWYKDESIENFSLNGNRSYSAVQTIGDVGEWGTTYNETVFTDSRTYLNGMNLTLGVGTSIETEVDYGWGAYVPATEEAEVVPAGYLSKEMAVSGSYTFLDLSANQVINRPSFNEKETYLIFPWDESLESSYKIVIDTATSTRGGNLYRPYMVYGYQDSLPVCGALQVSPSVNFLQPDADLDKLTRSTATDVSFSWTESAEDVWYRLLFVDDTLIENKYHKVNFYAPLNEAGPYVGDTVNAYWYTAYDEYPDNGTAFISGTYAPRIEGAAGWAHYVSGTDNILKTKNLNTAFGGAEEFSIIVHCRPKIGVGTGILMAVSSSAVAADNIFKITCLQEFDGSQYIRAQVSGAATGSVLQSTTQYPFDGVQPLAIIVTYNKNRDNNNLRLYINGKLEDTNDYTTDFGATGRIFIGGDTDMTSDITGYIEEITASTKEVFVPSQQGRYTHPTKYLADNTSNQLNKHQSKLFVMDYTNIRGATYLEVASTNTAAWNTTGVS